MLPERSGCFGGVRIIRARYRNADDGESWITPGAVHDYVIDLGYTATVFRRGHRIRLEISSSNFPHFDRNLNTAAPLGEGDEMAPASQRVLHDAGHPSRLVIQVAPDVRAP